MMILQCFLFFTTQSPLLKMLRYFMFFRMPFLITLCSHLLYWVFPSVFEDFVCVKGFCSMIMVYMLLLWPATVISAKSLWCFENLSQLSFSTANHFQNAVMCLEWAALWIIYLNFPVLSPAFGDHCCAFRKRHSNGLFWPLWAPLTCLPCLDLARYNQLYYWIFLPAILPCPESLATGWTSVFKKTHILRSSVCVFFPCLCFPCTVPCS